MPTARWQDRAKSALGLLPHPLGLWLGEGARLIARSSSRAARRRTRQILRALANPEHVLSGPFAGMRFQPRILSSQGGVLPKLIGSYEAECAPAIEALLASDTRLVVNVGAAEGYYAVGILRRRPDVKVVAFEMETAYHGALHDLAAQNGVEHGLVIRGECTPQSLQQTLAGVTRSAVLCDCEGYEDTLLDPALVPSLRASSMLIEVHEQLAPGVGDRLRERFRATHSLAVYRSGSTRAPMPPLAASLTAEDVDFATSEGRSGPMEWFWFEPR